MSAEPSMYQVPAEFMTDAPAPEVSVPAQPKTEVELAREALFGAIGEQGPTAEQIAAIELHLFLKSEINQFRQDHSQLRKEDFGLAV